MALGALHVRFVDLFGLSLGGTLCELIGRGNDAKRKTT